MIGGGAAGLMAAITAARQGAAVTLLEPNERLGKKVNITGKGRCNVTNDCDRETLLASIPGNGRFLYGALTRFTPRDTMAFFEALGVPLKVERGNRVFPVSDSAFDITNALERELKRRRVRFGSAFYAAALIKKRPQDLSCGRLLCFLTSRNRRPSSRG